MKGKIFFNCQVHTLDEQLPRAIAFVVYDGKILAMGSDDRILAEYGNWCEREDLGGRTVIPGLMDAHMHLEYYCEFLRNIDCETPTRAECLERVRQRAEITPEGEWITGFGWNQNAWPEGQGDAALLDTITTRHPILLTQKSGHSAWANTTAMRIAGVTAEMADPPGAQIGRKADGSLDGIFYEINAIDLIEKHIPALTTTELVAAIRSALQKLWSLGLTGIHDFDGLKVFSALQRLQEAEELQMRVCKGIPLADLAYATGMGIRSGFGNDMLRLGNVKAFMDGAIGPLTAWMLAPYEGNPGSTGIKIMDGEELFEHGKQAADGGLGMAVHAIGDRATHEALDAFENLRGYEKENLPGLSLRHRIEHVQLLHKNDLGRLAQLGVVASMQPLHATSDMYIADKHWGSRSEFGYALKSQLEAGAHLALGSDAPVESINPFTGLHAAVTRRRADGSPGPEGWYPAQKLTLLEALKGYTQGPAYAMGMEDRLGKLMPGYLADLLVLPVDPFEVDGMALKDIQPDRTMVAGEWVYRRD